MKHFPDYVNPLDSACSDFNVKSAHIQLSIPLRDQFFRDIIRA